MNTVLLILIAYAIGWYMSGIYHGALFNKATEAMKNELEKK